MPSWLSLNKYSGQLDITQIDVIQVYVDRTSLGYGDYDYDIQVNSDGGDDTVHVDMTVAVEAARLIAYRAALPAREGPDPMTFLAAMFCNEVAMNVAGKAVDLHGGYGCTRDFPVGRYFRDAKTLSLQKTFDYVKTVVGKMLLGIPMGPPPGAGGPPK